MGEKEDKQIIKSRLRYYGLCIRVQLQLQNETEGLEGLFTMESCEAAISSAIQSNFFDGGSRITVPTEAEILSLATEMLRFTKRLEQRRIDL
jgi:hypothetical protein